jgi:broad specificity phosphatase PhoE
MTIYLIRHGESTQGKEDAYRVLTTAGIRQAELTGQRLKKYGIERLYTSDMARAVQTADIINKSLLVNTLLRRDLREIDTGSFQNNWNVMNEFYPDFVRKFSEHIVDVPYPGGESGLDVMLRASNVIDEILSSGLKSVAVVAHGGTIRVLLCGILGLEQQRRFYIGLPFSNCGISVVKYVEKENRFYVHTINDSAHLEDQ